MLDVDYELENESVSLEQCPLIAIRKLKAALIYGAVQDLHKRNPNIIIRQAIAWFKGKTDAEPPCRFQDCIDGACYREGVMRMFSKAVRDAEELIDARTYGTGEEE